MKTFIPFLLVFLFLSTFDINSQNVFPDETVDQKWEYTTWNFWGGSCYKRIVKTGERKTVCSNNTFIEILDCNEQEEECFLIGYYRIQKDSIIVRTNYPYFKNAHDTVDCSEPEGLMYDFGVEKNIEIICQINSTFPSTFSDFWKVDEEVINYHGIDRTTLKMKYRPHPNAPNYINRMDWIEGLGSTIHPFYSLTCIGDHCEWEQQLTKVTRDGKIIYQDTTTFSFPCRTWVETKSPQKIDEIFIIAPNPASTSFSIHSKTEDSKSVQLIIRDLMGRIVVPRFDYGLIDPINIEGLTSGLFLVSIITKNGQKEYKLMKK